MTAPIPNALLEDFADKGRIWYCVTMDDSVRGKPYASAVWGQDLAAALLEARKALQGLLEHGYCCECAAPHSVDAEDAALRCLPGSP